MIDTSKIEYSLKNEFKRAVPPFLIYLASVIIIISFFKDVKKIGFNPYWLTIRLCYLPYILAVWRITKSRCVDRFYELPLWASGFYITTFCSYFALTTGGLKSDYIFGLIQFYFGIAVMPITALSFYTLSILSLLIYISLNLAFSIPTFMFYTTNAATIAPLLVFSFIVYFINSRIRNEKLNLQNTLTLTLQEQEETIKQQARKLTETETKAAISSLAAQMAHDIRSPLAALNTISTELLHLPEEPRNIIRGAVTRINDIANNLLAKYKRGQSKENEGLISSELMSALIDRMISEKRLQFTNKNILFDYYIDQNAQGMFASLILSEFERVISNLLNNAVEAITNHGRVEIKLSATPENIIITIEDNGQGISEELLQCLFQEGMTTKTHGHGLGLFHAKKFIKSWGGSINIKSTVGQGTLVTLRLPKALPPYLILIDDDALLAATWQIQARSVNKNIAVFNDIESIMNIIHSYEKNTAIYIDSDLGNNKRGEEFAKTLYMMGFNNIYLTTGFDREDFPPMFWIKDIIGKLPPF